MKAAQITLVKKLNIPTVSLIAIGAGLIAIHLNILDQTRSPNFWGMSLLFWVGISTLLWDKRHALNLKTDVLSSVLGTLLISSILLKSTSSIDPEPYLSPLLIGSGLGLLASGFKGLMQYWRELLLLFFLEIAQIQMFWLLDISTLTAKFSAFVLWYLGVNVSLQGIHILLPNSMVEVNFGCSGIEAIFHMSGIALLLLMIIPIKSQRKLLIPLLAIFLGFIVNGFRVALMAVLSASSKEAFDFWHTGDGSLIFSMIPVLLLGLFYYVLIRLDNPTVQHTITH